MAQDRHQADTRRPLMADDAEHVQHPADEDAGSPRNTAVDIIETLTFWNAGRLVRFLTLSAGISGLLFGFDTGVVSATLVSIGADLANHPLTTPDKSLVTAITSILALLSAPFTGYFADRYGRKSVILFPAILFILGAVIQALATYVWIMVFGRALVGAAVGVASGATPLYIAELAPAELRGRLVTVQSLFVTGGQVAAYVIGYLFAMVPHGWRWMVGLGAVPAAVQLVLLVWMPETPRWLYRNGREEHARIVLFQINENLPEALRADAVQDTIENIKAEILAEDKIYRSTDEQRSVGFWSATKELFSVSSNKRAFSIACMLQGLQQLSGFNCLMYFSATTFAMVGFTSPIGTSLSIALTNFVFTLVAFAWIDDIGRRNILLRSVPFMVIGLLACSLSFLFIDIKDAHSSAVYHGKQSAWPIFLVISMIIYVAAYAVGLGCVPWQQSELFPLRVRSVGSGLATALNWTSNAVIGLTFLPLMAFVGPSATFALYAATCVAGWFMIFRIYPETAGLEIEDISELLRDGYNVRKSIVEFRERQRVRTEQEAAYDDLDD